MARKNKLKKFAQLTTFENSFEFTPQMKGRWHSDYFQNQHPVTLELGCGTAQYTVSLAQMFPQRNFIGVDVKGDRIWQGAKDALELKLKNVAFLRIFIDFIPDYFEPGEVDEIWITFPDPYPKEPKQNKRLTSPFFLEQYRHILKPGAALHLKTDSFELYKFTKKILIADPEAHIRQDIFDLYQQTDIPDVLQIQTTYEKRHLAEARKIYYLQFTIN